MHAADDLSQCGAEALGRILEIGRQPHADSLALASAIAYSLVTAHPEARKRLFRTMARWLPVGVLSATARHPEFGDGWVVDQFDRGLPGAACPVAFACELLDLRGDGNRYVSLIPRRHPAYSRRGCLQYADRVWKLGMRLRLARKSAVERARWGLSA